MIIKDGVAFITCKCGEKIQILNVEENDWDELKTSETFQEHLKVCEEKE